MRTLVALLITVASLAVTASAEAYENERPLNDPALTIAITAANKHFAKLGYEELHPIILVADDLTAVDGVDALARTRASANTMWFLTSFVTDTRADLDRGNDLRTRRSAFRKFCDVVAHEFAHDHKLTHTDDHSLTDPNRTSIIPECSAAAKRTIKPVAKHSKKNHFSS